MTYEIFFTFFFQNFSFFLTLHDLFETVLQYKPKRLNTVTIVAGYNDYRLHPQELEQQWKNLINLVTNKFQPKTLIIPKTIQNCNSSEVNRKIYIHNHVLFNLINRFVHPHTLIVSPNLNLNLTPQMFCVMASISRSTVMISLQIFLQI